MRFVIYSLIFFLFNIGAFSSEALLPPSLYSRVIEGTELAYSDHLLEALQIFEDIILEMPDHPVGYFYQIAILEKIQADYLNSYREKDFPILFKRAIRVSKKYINRYPNNAVGYFFLGAIQGYYGMHYFRVEERIGVFVKGIKAVNNLKKANSLDPKLWDAYYGLGVYFYWKAKKAPFLYFFKKKRKKDIKKGFQYLKLAGKRGTYGTFEARGALVRCLINEKRYHEALKWINASIYKYPTSLYQLRFRADIYARLQNWVRVLEDMEKIHQMIKSKKYAGPECYAEVHFFLGLSKMYLNRKEEAKQHFQACLKIQKKHPKIRFYNPKYFSKSKKFLKTLN